MPGTAGSGCSRRNGSDSATTRPPASHLRQLTARWQSKAPGTFNFFTSGADSSGEPQGLLIRRAGLLVADTFREKPNQPIGQIWARLDAPLDPSFVMQQLPHNESFAAALAARGLEGVTVKLTRGRTHHR